MPSELMHQKALTPVKVCGPLASALSVAEEHASWLHVVAAALGAVQQHPPPSWTLSILFSQKAIPILGAGGE